MVERKGVFNVLRKELHYYRIKSVYIEEPFLFRIFNLANVHIKTSDPYLPELKLYGVEKCTLPSLDFINFTHMKPRIQGWPESKSWLEIVVPERDGDMIRINNINQYHPVHYHDKSYATKELIKYYESRVLG